MSDTKKKKTEDAKVPENGTSPAPTADPAAEAAKIIAEAEAKAAAIVAAAEEDAKAKAEAIAQAEAKDDVPAPKVDPMEELVEYEAPLLPGVKKRDILVGVNGETIRIQRGVPVKIKRKFREALQNAARQEFAAYESRQQIQKQGEKPLASM